MSTAVQQLVALPVPGFYTLRDCYQWLVPPKARASTPITTAEEVFDVWLDAASSGHGVDHLRECARAALEQRLDVLQAVVNALLATVGAACKARGHRLDTMLPLEVRSIAHSRRDPQPHQAGVSRTQAAPISMPTFLGLKDAGLSGLAFIAQLEAVASCGKSRALRQRHVAGVTTGTDRCYQLRTPHASVG